MSKTTQVLLVLSGIFAGVYLFAPTHFQPFGLLSVPIGLAAVWVSNRNKKAEARGNDATEHPAQH